MGYYDDPKNVNEYVDMAEGYDGRELAGILREHLESGASVLDMSIDPGKDLDLLSAHYRAVGSDTSSIFLDRYRPEHPDADLLSLDAATMDTDRRFDAIYSNKSLHHLTRQELAESFRHQARVLRSGDILPYSFWCGDREDDMHGMRFVHYTEDTLSQMIGNQLEIVDSQRYEEFEEDDSLWIVLRKRQ